MLFADMPLIPFMDPMPMSIAPRGRKILVYAPDFSKKWIPAIYDRFRGRYGMRWKVFDWPGKSNSAYPDRSFNPIAWTYLDGAIDA